MRTAVAEKLRPPGTVPGKIPLDFLIDTPWRDASVEPIAGDASGRRYFRLRNGVATAILMDASRHPDSIAPFLRIAEHLVRLRFSAPIPLARDEARGYLLLEDFGDATFAALLDRGEHPALCLELGVDFLVALHREPAAIPAGLRRYDVDAMLSDLELFLEWRMPDLHQAARAEFRLAWREVLPLAHHVPATLLLRDFHAGNLMYLARRKGVRRVGLLDFQDAYQGPATYDLASLVEDARRTIPDALRRMLIKSYFARSPAIDSAAFAASLAVVAAQRHTRVLGIFERLHRNGRPEYRDRHSARVERMLHRALTHPCLQPVRRWMQRYAR